MATTTATVTPDGLALTADAMQRLALKQGERVRVTIEPDRSGPIEGEAEKSVPEVGTTLGNRLSLEDEYSRNKQKRREVQEIELLIEELCGMFAGGPSMTDELLKERRDEELRSTW